MKYIIISVLFLINFANISYANSTTENQISQKPLIERYVLDELKQLRIDYQELKTSVTRQIADNKILANDRAIQYTVDTTNVLFYIITIAASLFVILGWKSLQDVKNSMGSVINKKIVSLTDDYEQRLNKMEEKIRTKSDQIFTNQEEIANTNVVHSLWMRAGLEKSNRERINLYDQILAIKPDDVEALTYKADVLLDIDSVDLALEFANTAINKDADYALAYWQRACAKTQLDDLSGAIFDLKTAITISEPLRKKILEEPYFEKLHNLEEFKQIISYEE